MFFDDQVTAAPGLVLGDNEEAPLGDETVDVVQHEVPVAQKTDNLVKLEEAERIRRDLEAEATSVAHLLMHTPYNAYCSSCVRAKMKRKHARRVVRDPSEAPKKFGIS